MYIIYYLITIILYFQSLKPIFQKSDKINYNHGFSFYSNKMVVDTLNLKKLLIQTKLLFLVTI